MAPSKILVRRCVVWAAACALLSLAYLLSVGPAVLFENRTQTGGPLLEFIYTPVFWLGKNTPLKEPLHAYLGYFQEIDNDWNLPRLVLESAPEDFGDVPNEQIIAGKMARFEASLNRDFMPECPPNGQRMGAFFKITTADKSFFPAGVRADKAWVIQKNVAWIPKFQESTTLTKKNDKMCLIVHAHGGPRWDPGTRVDVVIQLRDDDDNVYLMRVKNQVIRRTE